MLFIGFKYPTSNLYFPYVQRIRLVLEDEIVGDNAFMGNMVTRMFTKFEIIGQHST